MWPAVRDGVRVRRHPAGPAGRRHVFVLSGGGARGAAQAGALGALLEAGIRPSGIVGCSVGALNGAFLAADPTPERAQALADRWCRLERGHVFGGTRLSRWCNVVTRRPALFSPDPLRRLVTDWLPVDTFDALAVPLRVVTTSLTTGRAVYHGSGPLTDVLLASAALPGLFPPVRLPVRVPAADPGRDSDDTTDAPGCIDATEQHVDGGVADLVPVAGAVDLAPTDVWLLDVAAAAGTGSWRVRSALDVLVASLAAAMRCRPMPRLDGVAMHHLALGGRCDGPAGLMDFSRTADLVSAGRAVGAAAASGLSLVPSPR